MTKLLHSQLGYVTQSEAKISMPVRYVYLVFTSIACLHTYLKYPSKLESEFTLNFKSTSTWFCK